MSADSRMAMQEAWRGEYEDGVMPCSVRRVIPPRGAILRDEVEGGWFCGFCLMQWSHEMPHCPCCGVKEAAPVRYEVDHPPLWFLFNKSGPFTSHPIKSRRVSREFIQGLSDAGARPGFVAAVERDNR